MYAVSNEYKAAIAASARELRAKAVIDGVEVTDNTDLKSITLDRGAQTSKLIGNAIAQKATVTVLNKAGAYDFMAGYEFTVHVGVDIAGVPEYAPSPIFTAQTPVIDTVAKAITLMGYDKMVLFENHVVSEINIEFPATLRTYAGAICALCGVLLAAGTWYHDDLVLTTAPNFNGDETCREAVARIAECAFCNAIINRNNQLQFISVLGAGTVADIDGVQYFDFKRGDLYGPINTVVLDRQPQGDVVYRENAGGVAANGRLQLVISDNPFLDDKRDEVIDSMLQTVLGLQLYPYTLSWRGDPVLDLYDKIRVQDLDGNYYPVIYTGETIDYDGGMKSEAAIKTPAATVDQTAVGTSVKEILRRTQLSVDKANGKIESLVQSQEELSGAIEGRYSDLDRRLVETETRLTQTADAITASMSKTGGNNLLRNSVGFKGFDYWAVTDPAHCSVLQDSFIDQSTVAGSAFVIGNGTVSQAFNAILGAKYNLSFLYKKVGVGAGVSKVDMQGTGAFNALTAADTVDEFESVSVTFTAKAAQLTLVLSSDNDDFTVSDLRVTLGDSAQTWSQGAEEVYGKTHQLDSTGLTLRSLDGGVFLQADNDSLYIKDGSNVKAEVSDERVYGQKVEAANSMRVGNIEIRTLSPTRIIIAGV